MKKTLRDTNTAREAKDFCPAADPLSRGAVRPKFNQLEMVRKTDIRWNIINLRMCEKMKESARRDANAVRWL